MLTDTLTAIVGYVYGSTDLGGEWRLGVIVFGIMAGAFGGFLMGCIDAPEGE